MQLYDYKVIPAPVRGEKDRGLKTGAERFAHALTLTINEMAAGGWEYCRAETLPAEERSGLASKVTVIHHLLVFRRATAAAGRDGMRLSRPEVGADSAETERRAVFSALAPEGRAPRLGPADDETL